MTSTASSAPSGTGSFLANRSTVNVLAFANDPATATRSDAMRARRSVGGWLSGVARVGLGGGCEGETREENGGTDDTKAAIIGGTELTGLESGGGDDRGRDSGF